MLVTRQHSDQDPMPNLFAFIVLFSYPLVVIVLFRRLPLPQALVWSVMGGYLFLPEHTGFDLPLLPEFNKALIPSLTAAVMCMLAPQPTAHARPARTNPRDRNHQATPDAEAPQPQRRSSLLANLCIVVMFLVPVGVVLTNTDWVVFGPLVIPGMRLYDAFSMMLSAGVMLLPFFLARRHLVTHEAHMAILWAFVLTGLVYSLLILVEIRLSPQLHRWLYGFHAHDFIQQIRRGGFRPTVFIQHGLRVGIFMLMTVLAALILYKVYNASQKTNSSIRDKQKADTADRGLPIYVGLYLFVILFISKALGAFMIAWLFVPFLLMAKPERWRVLAGAAALLVLLYPMARSAGIVPVDQIHAASSLINEDRADSFRYRLDNEDRLLARAAEKPLLGWGGWGRSLIYDPETGRDISVVDGTWVGVFGSAGWIGYLAQFGLLTLPIFAYFFTRTSLRTAIVSQGLCLILAANLIDLVPNSGLTPVTWMVAGALLGRFERREPRATLQPRDRRSSAARNTPIRGPQMAATARARPQRRSMS